MNYAESALSWSMKQVDDQAHALQFVQKVGQCMCVTSPVVSQLYSNYQVAANYDQSELMITPDFEKHLEVFDFIDSQALVKSNLVIMPRVMNGVERLCLAHINKDQDKFHLLPLGMGLAKVKAQNPHFLPVLNSREVDQWCARSPMLQIYQLNLNALENLSPFVLKNIQDTINDKLNLLALAV